MKLHTKMMYIVAGLSLLMSNQIGALGGKNYFLCRYSHPGAQATVAVEYRVGGGIKSRELKTIIIDPVINGVIAKWQKSWNHGCNHAEHGCNTAVAKQGVFALFQRSVLEQFGTSEMPKNINTIVTQLWDQVKDQVEISCYSLKKDTTYTPEEIRERFPYALFVD